MTPLETLRPLLDAIAPTEIQEPDLPMAVALQEAHELHIALQSEERFDRILAVGLDPSLLTVLPTAISATRQAQSQWVVLRDRSKPQAQRDREAQGEALRSELLSACRWNLRDDTRAQGVLDAIVAGDGIPDLVQDLLDLATLITRHQDRFAADETFDALERAEAARSLATEISEGLAVGRSRDDQRAAKQLRDRAFSYMDRVVTDIRTAGRYAFGNDPRQAAVFASRYLRRRRQRYARRRRDEAALPRLTPDPTSTPDPTPAPA
ncbi:MAG: hypothetical protein AAGF11_54910 [Myxococcota bacterium]